MTARLSLDAVAAARGGRTILAGVNLTLAPGDIILLKGANGAGKTTLLRAIAGLSPIAAGTVRINGVAGEERRTETIYCGHADGSKAAMTTRETLRFWSRIYGAPAQRIGEAIAALALAGLEEKRVAVLSAGQRRRLGLARLIIAARPVWLLDEPAASIDAASVERLIALVETHARGGGAALIATHDRLAIGGARAVVLQPAEAAA